MRTVCHLRDTSFHDRLLRAVATVRFFEFYRAGEIAVPSVSAFDRASHLAWGDVSISEDRLKRSKMDQFGRGTESFLGATGDEICQVKAMTSYVARLGTSPGAFFRFESGAPLTKAKFVDRVGVALMMAGQDTPGIASA